MSVVAEQPLPNQ